MKIRQGFVSNSSSSSFIVNLTTCRPGKNVQDFIEKLKKLEQDYDSDYGSWFGGDSGRDRDDNFEIQGNFIQIGSWYAPEGLWELVEEYFTEENTFSMDY